MAKVSVGEDRLKELLKAALVEVLEERKDLVQDLIEEALEDLAMARALEEGEQSPHISREVVFRRLLLDRIRQAVDALVAVRGRVGAEGPQEFPLSRLPGWWRGNSVFSSDARRAELTELESSFSPLPPRGELHLTLYRSRTPPISRRCARLA
jgi:hypothetical protein